MKNLWSDSDAKAAIAAALLPALWAAAERSQRSE